VSLAKLVGYCILYVRHSTSPQFNCMSSGHCVTYQKKKKEEASNFAKKSA